MLTEFFEAAMERAQFKFLDDDEIYFGHVPELPGVWAAAETMEETREELREVLEDWVMLQLRGNLPIPEVGGISLEPHAAVV